MVEAKFENSLRDLSSLRLVVFASYIFHFIFDLFLLSCRSSESAADMHKAIAGFILRGAIFTQGMAYLDIL